MQFPAPTQGEHQTTKNITIFEPPIESQGEQPDEVAKLNEGKELTIHNAEEKKEEIITWKMIQMRITSSPYPKDSKYQLLEPTPPKDPSKGKEVVVIEEQVNKLFSFQEEGGSNPEMPNIMSFITPEGLLSQDKINEQLREFKRLADLKVEKDKSEVEVRKLLNLATLKARAQKWTEHEEKKAKMIKDYNHQISFRADPLPITKISYIVNQHKEATMK
ncbi:hypothetical protein Tco_1051491, partial [Tanacetum coccineum]